MTVKETIEHGELEILTPREASDLVDRGKAILIDVRTPAEFGVERIRGALLMPLAEFEPQNLPDQKEKRIILFCASGVRSKHAANRMLEAGLGPIAHMEGGIQGWKRAYLPFIATDPFTGNPREIILQ